MTRPEQTPLIGAAVRQSTLRTFSQCPQACAWSMEDNGTWSSEEAAIGTCAHGVLEGILDTLRSTGDERVETDDALRIMRKLAVDPDMPHLSAHGLSELEMLTRQIARMHWTASKLLTIETRLTTEVECSDGRMRAITARPDWTQVIDAQSLRAGDMKTSWSVPASPRDGDYTRMQGRPYISETGWLQLDTAALLLMHKHPRVEYVELFEWYPRAGDTRTAYLTRRELPAVEARIGVLLQRFDAMQTGAMEPEARAGSHCRRICPRVAECPIPSAERRSIVTGNGELVDEAQASAAAVVYAAADAQRTRLTAALKPWCEEHPIPLSDGYVGWAVNGNGSRRFGVHSMPSKEEP
jgi:hypothetical protein